MRRWTLLSGSGSICPPKLGWEVGSRMMAAKARAVVNFPTPGGPWKIQAWWMRPDLMLDCRTERARSWPRISLNGMGIGATGGGGGASERRPPARGAALAAALGAALEAAGLEGRLAMGEVMGWWEGKERRWGSRGAGTPRWPSCAA